MSDLSSDCNTPVLAVVDTGPRRVYTTGGNGRADPGTGALRGSLNRPTPVFVASDRGCTGREKTSKTRQK